MRVGLLQLQPYGTCTFVASPLGSRAYRSAFRASARSGRGVRASARFTPVPNDVLFRQMPVSSARARGKRRHLEPAGTPLTRIRLPLRQHPTHIPLPLVLGDKRLHRNGPAYTSTFRATGHLHKQVITDGLYREEGVRFLRSPCPLVRQPVGMDPGELSGQSRIFRRLDEDEACDRRVGDEIGAYGP